MIIRKIKLAGALALLSGALLMTGCEKEVLDLQPYSTFSDVSAFSSKDRVVLAVNGAYDAAQSGFYAGGQVRGYPFGAANIEQGDMRGEDMLNNALFYQITYEATQGNVTANNDFMFQTLYALVNKANLTIEGIQDAASKNIITAQEAAAFEGEMRFLRAMAYHELLLHVARPYADGNGNKPGVLYYDFGINSETTVEKARALKRADFTVAKNYASILADLDYAETNLPEVGAVKTYRASKAAAIALKMRVKLHMQDWNGVIAEGNKLVPATAPFVSPIGGWKLTPAPEGPFANNQSDESIFSIKNDANDNAGVNGAMGSMYTNPALGGRGLVRISPIIWSDPRWECSDLRRTQLAIAATNTAGATTAVYSNKYRDITNRADAAPQIRYAEVLLTLAEAEARVAAGVSPRAVELLNAVRNRAVTNPLLQYNIASFVSKNALIEAILFERRVELLGEGKRWGDIHRLAVDPNFAPIPGGGIPAKVGTGAATSSMFNCAGVASIPKSVAAIPYEDNRFLWPIPLAELNQNPNFTQNPGY